VFVVITLDGAIVSVPVRGWSRVLGNNPEIDDFNTRFHHHREQFTSIATWKAISILKGRFKEGLLVVK
jgi:hypothetical protein